MKNKVVDLSKEKRMIHKKVLITASMASMLENFNLDNIEILSNMGYEIVLAANFEDEDSNSRAKVNNFRKKMNQKGYEIIQIDFCRDIKNVKKQLQSYIQLKKLEKVHFDLIHCNSPICAAMTRLVFRNARKRGTSILYTAHGFHFYKGAPLKNWLFFFPVERICSKWTDVLLTINREDYTLAKRKMKAKCIEYIPGIGVDINKFANSAIDKSVKRSELNISSEAFLLLSVGELNKNKNHEIVIRAIAQLNNPNIHYAIAGIGSLQEYLMNLVSELHINEQVHFLGFREDVAELYKMADVCCFPSIREGLGLAAIEGMASGLPIIATENRGTREYIKHNVNGFFCSNSNCIDFAEAINQLYMNVHLRKQMGKNGYRIVSMFDKDIVDKKMMKIYSTFNKL